MPPVCAHSYGHARAFVRALECRLCVHVPIVPKPRTRMRAHIQMPPLCTHTFTHTYSHAHAPADLGHQRSHESNFFLPTRKLGALCKPYVEYAYAGARAVVSNMRMQVLACSFAEPQQSHSL